MIVYGTDEYPHGIEAMREWINARLKASVSEHARFVGRTKDGELVAVCAFAGYTGDDVELSLAAEPGSGTLGLIHFIFGYVFQQLKCARCTAKIREDNHASIKLIRRMGFTYEGRQRKGAAGKDLLLYGLLKEEFYGKFTRSAEAGRPYHCYPSTGTGQPHQSGNAVREPDVQREHA